MEGFDVDVDTRARLESTLIGLWQRSGGKERRGYLSTL